MQYFANSRKWDGNQVALSVPRFSDKLSLLHAFPCLSLLQFKVKPPQVKIEKIRIHGELIFVEISFRCFQIETNGSNFLNQLNSAVAILNDYFNSWIYVIFT